MVKMARPRTSPAESSRGKRTSPRLAMNSANAEAPTAARNDPATTTTSYEIGTERRKASMATKCMLQMPVPMATLPPESHASRARPRAAVTRPASVSAVYDAQIASRIESATNGASCVSVITRLPQRAGYGHGERTYCLDEYRPLGGGA